MKLSVVSTFLWGSPFLYRVQHLVIHTSSICMHITVDFHTVTVFAVQFDSASSDVY